VAEGAGPFADAVCRLLENDDLRRSIGAAGQKKVRAEWSWTQITAKLENIYHEIISEQRRKE
jgi:glycosyltransferase involved in cell wall biosynthesis